MRILMLGWELPPHISGGLGTACLGLVEGLANDGVEVIFVVPRAWGDEDQRSARIIGADAVDLPLPAQTAPRPMVAHGPPGMGRGRAVGNGDPAADDGLEADDGAGDPNSARAAVGRSSTASGSDTLAGGASADSAVARFAQLADRVRVLGIDSPLRPYLDVAGYAGQISQAAIPTGYGAAPITGSAQGSDAAQGGGADEASPVVTGGTVTGASVAGRAVDLNALRPVIAEAGAPGTPASPGLPTTERLAFSGGYGLDLFGEVGRYARVVDTLARRETFDVIHAHDWMTFPAGAAAAAATGRPLVVHVHASEFDRNGEHPDSRICDIEYFGLHAADRVICVSHFTAAIVRERYGVPAERIRVVHNAVTQAEEGEAFHAVKTVEGPIVLFLGRITHQKGPDYFLEAARRVVALQPDAKFVMSGSGNLLPGVIERTAALGLARNVFFTGFLRGRDVERMYALADVYVMPSVSEPFGISPLEAMALDVPTIVSRQSGVSEVVSSALKFDYWDVEDLANKILAVLRRPALHRQLIAEGGEEVRRMRWDLRGRLMHQHYRELMP